MRGITRSKQLAANIDHTPLKSYERAKDSEEEKGDKKCLENGPGQFYDGLEESFGDANLPRAS